MSEQVVQNPTPALRSRTSCAPSAPHARRRKQPRGIIDRLKEPLRRLRYTCSPSDLSDAIRSFGIGAGDTLIVHSAYAGMKYFSGNAMDAVEAVVRSVAPGGTVAMPAFPFAGWSFDYLRKNPTFDVCRSPALTGMLCEIFRRRPGTLRSLHATHSVTAAGPRAAEIVADHHHSRTPFDERSPWHHLCRQGGWVVIIGLPLRKLVFSHCHYFEEQLAHLLNVTLYWPHPFVTTVRDAAGNQFTLPAYAHHPDHRTIRNYLPLNKAYVDAGVLKHRRLGEMDIWAGRIPALLAETRALILRGITAFAPADRPGTSISTAVDNPPPLAVCIDPELEDPRRRYGLTQLLRTAGLRWTHSPHSNDALYYGDDPERGRRAAVWIRADRHWNENAGSPTFATADALLQSDGPISTALRPNCIPMDLARTVFQYLTLDAERTVTQRDPHGRVNGRESPFAAADLLEQPPLHQYAEALAQTLARSGIPFQTKPRWPRGARYAVCITHDVDDPETTRAWGPLVSEIMRGADRPRRHAYWQLREHFRLRGAYDACLAPPARRREWDFRHFRDIERRCGLTSAFYFAVVNHRQGHPLDVRYDAAAERYRRLYSDLDAEKWEIGLHASYQCTHMPHEIDRQARRLNGLVPTPVRGVRHHYLQVDHANPIHSLIQQADAGLLYDTSLGFNDVPGFRAGIALPFQPYDSQRCEARDFIELPLSIADMHLSRKDAAASTQCVLDHLRRVRSLGGLAVLNWHIGHWHSDSGWRAAFGAACEFLAADSDVWVANPKEVATWWLDNA